MENRSSAYVEIILQGKLVRFPLKSNSACRIGRNRESEICLPDGSTSRDHALLECTGGTPYLSDLGSRNGTFVNGRRVGEPVALRCCDVIDIGHYRLSFHNTVAPRKPLSSSACNSRFRRAVRSQAAAGRASSRYSVTARGSTPTRTAEGRMRER
jgi:pSer/pThr/pTyr-binding forkhead associated (FHA) protein